jgi:hypothetical protein
MVKSAMTSLAWIAAAACLMGAVGQDRSRPSPAVVEIGFYAFLAPSDVQVRGYADWVAEGPSERGEKPKYVVAMLSRDQLLRELQEQAKQKTIRMIAGSKLRTLLGQECVVVFATAPSDGRDPGASEVGKRVEFRALPAKEGSGPLRVKAQGKAETGRPDEPGYALWWSFDQSWSPSAGKPFLVDMPFKDELGQDRRLVVIIRVELETLP